MKHPHSAAGLAAVLLALAACGQAGTPAPGDTGPSAATVNGKTISQSLFDLYVTSVAQQSAANLSTEQKDQLLDQVVAMQLAAEEAQKAGLDRNSDVAGQLELNRLNVLADAQFKKYLEDHPVSDQDVQTEYDAQIAAIPKEGSQEYHARHILVADQATAQGLIAKLKSGADFSELARQNSSDGSKDNGGDLGWFTPASMVKPFADAVVALEKGKITDEPVQSQFGWHVIKLEDTRVGAAPEPPPALDEVRDRVVQIVQRKRLQAYLDELRKAAKIQKSG